MKILSNIFIVLFALTLSSPSYAEEIVGKVIAVADGDTLTILDNQKKEIKIRLAEIDAPEKDQPFGSKSKSILSNRVFGKNVKVQKQTIDKYGRTIGRVYESQSDINLELVKLGAAWAYKQYLTDNNFLVAEAEARNKKLGLWALQADQIIPPWEWRHGAKKIQKKAPLAPIADISKITFACSGKLYCREMLNCDEAKFYLTNCNLKRLDSDRDGIPCEALCGH